MALIAVYLGLFKDWYSFLSPGERAVILIVAANREQAKVVRRYIGGILQTKMLEQFVENRGVEEIELTGGVAIEVSTCSYRSVRGRSVAVAILDEIAFWRDDTSANPDTEVVNAIRAAQATFGDQALMIGASSPYSRRGVLWENYQRYFGKDDPATLVWQAATRVMNPSVPQDFIDAEFERDPVSAEAEYHAQFRTDIAAFVLREVVDAAVIPGRFEMGPITNGEGQKSYFGFTDPSGGSADSFTLAVAHREADTAILDCIREVRPPFSPDAVVAEFADVLRVYGLSEVTGDRYSGEFVRELFSGKGIRYAVSEKTKSQIYSDFLPMLNSRRAELLDNKKLVAQLCGLERRTARGGRDSIDHGPGSHDDCINAAAGALVGVGVKMDSTLEWAMIGERLGGGSGVSYAERYWQVHEQPEILQVETPPGLTGGALEAWARNWKESHPGHWAKDVQFVDGRKAQ